MLTGVSTFSLSGKARRHRGSESSPSSRSEGCRAGHLEKTSQDERRVRSKAGGRTGPLLQRQKLRRLGASRAGHVCVVVPSVRLLHPSLELCFWELGKARVDSQAVCMAARAVTAPLCLARRCFPGHVALKLICLIILINGEGTSWCASNGALIHA